MSALLKEYEKINQRFRSAEVKAQFKDEREWSVALNTAKAKVLEKMNVEELTYLLDKTSGYMRSVLADYIKKAKEKKTQKKTAKPYDELAAAIG